MTEYNLYESKFRTLESFYMWIEQGSNYELAASQSIYYDQPANELDSIVIPLIIATRFVRNKKILTNDFKLILKNKIKLFNTINLNHYNLKKQEIKELKEEILEVYNYISN